MEMEKSVAEPSASGDGGGETNEFSDNGMPFEAGSRLRGNSVSRTTRSSSKKLDLQKDDSQVDGNIKAGELERDFTAEQKEKFSKESKGEVKSAVSDQKGSKLNQYYLLCIIGLIVAVVSYYKGYPTPDGIIDAVRKTSHSVKGDWEGSAVTFYENLQAMRRKYPKQLVSTWREIFSAVDSTLSREEPRQPSPLVFLLPPKMDLEFGSCLAKEIGLITHRAFENATGTKFTSEILEMDENDFNKAKDVTGIHNRLNQYFKNGKVVIFRNAHLVKTQDLIMIFHAFCDNSAAPDKRATFIFLLPVPQETYKKFEWTHENGVPIAQSIFNSSWTSVNDDKRPATITRVAASAALLNPMDVCKS